MCLVEIVRSLVVGGRESGVGLSRGPTVGRRKIVMVNLSRKDVEVDLP